MSANETVHTSATGGQKAGNDERYDLVPAEALRRLAVHAGTTVYARRGGSFHQMMAHAWAFWAGETTDPVTLWDHLPAAAFEAFCIVDPWLPPTWVLNDQRPGAERYDRIPPDALRQLARHFGAGARKYADDNWTRGYDWRLTFAAALRHAEQHRAGETHDPETGSHHLIAFAWHMLVLDEFTRINRGGDTRYATKVRAWLDAENAYRAGPSESRDLAIHIKRWLEGDDLDKPLYEDTLLWAEAEANIRADVPAPRVINCRELGDAEKDAERTDCDGDQWRWWRSDPAVGMGGRWQFRRRGGEWNTCATEDYVPPAMHGPYIEVVTPRPPRVVDHLTDTERDTEWVGKAGRYRWSNERGRWMRNPGTADFWHPTECTTAAFGPYTEHKTTGEDE